MVDLYGLIFLKISFEHAIWFVAPESRSQTEFNLVLSTSVIKLNFSLVVVAFSSV
jgi:hypothetical protein